MGPPIALVAFGPVAIAPAAIIFSFDIAVHFIFTPLLMALDKQGRAGGKARLAMMFAAIGWNVISHPFILATIAGFAAAATGFTPPGPAGTILNLLELPQHSVRYS
jgi:malonate transporter